MIKVDYKMISMMYYSVTSWILFSVNHQMRVDLHFPSLSLRIRFAQIIFLEMAAVCTDDGYLQMIYF